MTNLRESFLRTAILGALMLLSAAAVCVAETDAVAVSPTDVESGIELGETRTHKVKFGLKIQAVGMCRGIQASVPIPMDWPEQQAQIVKEEISSEVRAVKYRTLDGGAKQMLISIPRLNPGETAEAVLTFTVTRQVINGPEETDQYRIPKSPGRAVKKYLGAGPFIESRNAQIRRLAKKITRPHDKDWDKVAAIYDHVRDHVEYRESELKGAVQTLKDGVGDCEAMTSLFVALCRAAKIPARMVWVLDHSYPEFYLVDADKKGHWFPCQISGSRALGNMPETRTIIQKGDNFKIPETRERRRYVAVQLKASTVRGGAPKIFEVMQMVSE